MPNLQFLWLSDFEKIEGTGQTDRQTDRHLGIMPPPGGAHKKYNITIKLYIRRQGNGTAVITCSRRVLLTVAETRRLRC